MKRLWHILIRIVKITGLVVLLLLILLFATPYFFPGKVEKAVKSWANGSIRGKLNFSRARLSFLAHFPSLTLTLYDLTLLGSPPFEQDSLIQADDVSLGINLKDLIAKKEVHINKIFVDKALIHIEVDEKGNANYNIYNSTSDTSSSHADSSSASLKLEQLLIQRTRLIYEDRSIPMEVEAKDLHYTGSADFSQSVFDLVSKIEIDSLLFRMNGMSYLQNKRLGADLITRINTHSLSLFLEKNHLHINQLEFAFKGALHILKDGYNMQLELLSKNARLQDFISALPPHYLSWLEKTKVGGTVDLHASMTGDYISTRKQFPAIDAAIWLRDGTVAHQGAPTPARNLYLDLKARLPSMNLDSLQIRLDSLHAELDHDVVDARIHTTGLTYPDVTGRVRANLDLEKFNQAFGIEPLRLKGILRLQMQTEGKIAYGYRVKNFRTKERVLKSIPNFTLDANLRDGYFQLDSLSRPIRQINARLSAACHDHQLGHISLKLEDLTASSSGDSVHLRAQIRRLQDSVYDLDALARLDLSHINSYYPLDSLWLAGNLLIRLAAKGNYSQLKARMPVLHAVMQLENGRLQTKYYPHPFENIQFNLKADDPDGTWKAFSVSAEPIRFIFEGKPLQLYLRMSDLSDPLYAIRAKGQVDIGRINQAFSQDRVSLAGIATLDCNLQGRQSDAMAGRYDRLRNSGSLRISNLELHSLYLPKPIRLKEGAFSFQEEKMWFDKFFATYGNSDLQLDGFLSNAINYFFDQQQDLKGNFNLHSRKIVVDEWAAFDSLTSGTGTQQAARSDPHDSASGVIMVPPHINLAIHANAADVLLRGLNIQDFSGGLTIANGEIQLSETSFNTAGCKVQMDGRYGNTGPASAFFEYHVQAADFDVQRAYREVKIFRDLVTAAGKAQGIISLDYTLGGKMRNSMMPYYPSLTGGGVISVKKVKMNGLKLFNVISSKTEKQEIKDPDLSKIDFKTSIKNNIITLQRVKFKTSGLRIRLEGQSSLQGQLNLKMRLGLPPLGIIGVPIRVTGNAENPKVKLGNKDKEPLQEQTDEEDK